MSIRKFFSQIFTILAIGLIIYAAFALMSLEPGDVKAQAVETKNSVWEDIKSFFTDGFTEWSNQFATGRQSLPTSIPTP